MLIILSLSTNSKDSPPSFRVSTKQDAIQFKYSPQISSLCSTNYTLKLIVPLQLHARNKLNFLAEGHPCSHLHFGFKMHAHHRDPAQPQSGCPTEPGDWPVAQTAPWRLFS